MDNTFVYNEPKYNCPVHGEIENNVIDSVIPGYEMTLCWRCVLEKLTELGVQKVKREDNNT